MWSETLDARTLETLISAAVAAPSIHNTQPWRFRLDPDTVTLEIRAVADRGLRHIDPTGRALHLSVGCAVLNLRVAVAHFGREPVTRLLPRPDEPDLLATVRFGGPVRTTPFPGLFEALWRRHSSRFPFSDVPVPTAVAAELAEAAHSEGALLRRPGPRATDRLLRLTRDAEHRNTTDADRAAESRRWVHEPTAGSLGMPPATVGPQDFRERVPLRDFGAHRHPSALASRPFETRPSINVLFTAHDRKGRLAACRTGPGTRPAGGHRPRAAGLPAAPGPGMAGPARAARPAGGGPPRPLPQMVIRLGYGPEGPASPRRSAGQALDESVLPLSR